MVVGEEREGKQQKKSVRAAARGRRSQGQDTGQDTGSVLARRAYCFRFVRGGRAGPPHVPACRTARQFSRAPGAILDLLGASADKTIPGARRAGACFLSPACTSHHTKQQTTPTRPSHRTQKTADGEAVMSLKKLMKGEADGESVKHMKKHMKGEADGEAVKHMKKGGAYSAVGDAAADAVASQWDEAIPQMAQWAPARYVLAAARAAARRSDQAADAAADAAGMGGGKHGKGGAAWADEAGESVKHMKKHMKGEADGESVKHMKAAGEKTVHKLISKHMEGEADDHTDHWGAFKGAKKATDGEATKVREGKEESRVVWRGERGYPKTNEPEPPSHSRE